MFQKTRRDVDSMINEHKRALQKDMEKFIKINMIVVLKY
jgi:hypothetical protein